ncbi:unnamed protein product [Orchesella dallaii]|uniref:Uncharacterized protein n=1 Tax=Orchesella dallaii TaxID=48710 RepID=A0ABP1QFP4_9HEXA
MDRSSSKKAVRFSSPFETGFESSNNVNTSDTARRESTSHRRNSSALKSNRTNSWDAFDAKMSKSKTVAPKIVENQFLELSVSQNKSLNLDAEDFSNLSFQDPKGLIDRDENERLQFMNSQVSFSEGIEQVEAPSLLSITNYFQQGSSFPVPYVGNDSTMMFGARENLAGIRDSDLHSQIKRRTSSQSQISRSTSSSKRCSSSPGSAVTVVAGDDKPDLSRNNSLAKFFLGPQSNGMNSNDILEYVIDYCKRRASGVSDASDFENSPPSVNLSADKSSDKQDSGIGFANEEKTVKSNVGKKSSNTDSETPYQNVTNEKNLEMTRRKEECTPPQKDDNEESVMLAEARSLKSETPLLNVSDVGSIDGFEKFKKNLHHSRNVEDRYKGKTKHHAEFERKRLYVDERFSHPGLSPKAFKGPGSTASLERPSKNMCNSPPEKLVPSKKESIRDKCQSPVIAQASRNSGGQYHSTPVTSESYISKLVSTTYGRGEKPRPAKLDTQVEKENSDKQKRQKVSHSRGHDSSSSSNSQQVIESCSGPKNVGALDNRSELSNKGSNGSLHEKQTESELPLCAKRPTSLCTDPSKVLKPSNVLPEGLSILPVIHSGLQQHFTGQQCSCPHQCGQQPSPHGMMPGHGPIVIHIHLPCTVATSGTVVHPTPSLTDHK